MRKKLVLILIVMVVALTAMFGCDGIKWGPISGGPAATDAVSSNGGLVVKKGEYIYFINGMDTYSSDNTFGEVIKGALVRMKIDDKDNQTVERIIPKLLISNYSEGGFYVFGDLIYYATPNSERTSSGSINYNALDFMVTKIDGTGTRRLLTAKPENNENGILPYKFYQQDGKVYLVYIEQSVLYTVDTSARTTKAVDINKDADELSKVTSFAFGDDCIYYTMSQHYTDKLDNEFEHDYNIMYSAKPDGSNITEISPDGKGGEVNKTFKYSITKFGEGILFFTKTDTLLAGKGVWGYNVSQSHTEATAFKRFTANDYSVFLPISWTKGILVYAANEVRLFNSDGTNRLIMFISGITMYQLYTEGNDYFLMYGIKDSDNSGSDVNIEHIWKMPVAVDDANAKPLLRSQTTQLTYNGIHASWLKPEILDGNLYFINSNTTDEDAEYQYYTYRIKMERTQQEIDDEEFFEEFIGIYDERELED